MTLMEKMRYMPKKGDILIFNDGAFMEVLEYKKGLEVTVKWHAKGAEPSEIRASVQRVRVCRVCGVCCARVRCGLCAVRLCTHRELSANQMCY